MGDDRARRRLHAMAAALPEVVIEGEQHIGFAVRGRRFAWFLEDHHGDGVVALTCRCPPGVNRDLVERAPDRYFYPSYTGPKGWVGLRLDSAVVDWDEVDELLTDAYRLAAPKALVRQLMAEATARRQPD